MKGQPLGIVELYIHKRRKSANSFYLVSLQVFFLFFLTWSVLKSKNILTASNPTPYTDSPDGQCMCMCNENASTRVHFTSSEASNCRMFIFVDHYVINPA